MPGNKIGGLKAAATNKARYGKDWYARIGRKGGQNGHTGGWASENVGKDGLTGHERARKYGAIGGAKSKRGPAKRTPHLSEEEYTIRSAEERNRLVREIARMEAEND